MNLDWLFEDFQFTLTMLGVAVTLFQLLRIALAVSSDYWPSTQAMVDSVELDRNDGGDVAFSSAQALYRYQVGSKSYSGSRIWLWPRTYFRHSTLVDRLCSVLPERPHPVRYVPFLPRVAVLLPGAGLCDLIVLGTALGVTAAIASPIWSS